MRTLLHLIASLMLIQGPTIPIGGTGPYLVRGNGFAHIGNSTTACSNGFANQTKCVFALHVNPSAGNLIRCQAFWANPGSVTATLVGSNNGTYASIGTISTGSGFSGQMFQLASSAAGAETITMTVSSAITTFGWECTTYSYTGTLQFDGTPIYFIGNASGTTATIGTITTTNTNGLIVADCLGVTTACSVGSGYTSRNDTASCRYNGTTCVSTGNFNADYGNLMEDVIGAATGSKSATFGTGNNDGVNLGMTAY